MLNLRLGFIAGDENVPPTDIAWAGSHVIAENVALGTVVGGLLTPNEGEVGTFTMVDGSNFLFDVSGDNVIVTGVLDFETATSHNVTIKFTDVGGLSITEQFSITVTDVAETEPEDPPPDGDVVHDDTFDKPPVVTEVDGAIKLHGKKASGSTGKFIYDIGQALAGSRYVIEYDPDFTLLTQQGKLAMVGFGLKSGNDFHMAGLKGDGSTGLHAYQISGDDLWNQTSGFTTDDGGAAAHGTQAGPNWLRFEVSEDGNTYTLSTSGEGLSWTAEYVAEIPSPLADVDSPATFGIAAFFDGTDAGPFSVEISLWSSGFRGALVRTLNNLTVDAGPGVTVTWDAETTDIGNWHSISSNTERVTVPAGIDFVIVDGHLRAEGLGGVTAFFVQALLLKSTGGGAALSSFNGATGQLAGMNAGSSVSNRSFSTGPVPVLAGDYFTMFYQENAPGIVNTSVAALSSSLAARAIENFSGCMVRKASNLNGQNLTSGTVEATFDTVVYELGGDWFDAGDSAGLVVPADIDHVIITANAYIENSTGSQSQGLTILKNGLNNFDGAASSNFMPQATNPVFCTVTGPVPVVEGDRFSSIIFTTSDTSVDIIAARTNFSIYALRNLFGCMVELSADMTGVNLTAGAFLAFASEVMDIGGWHDNAVNNDRITVPPGVRKVVVTSNMRVEAATANGNFGTFLFKNGRQVPGGGSNFTQLGSAVGATSARSAAIPVVAGDRFQMWAEVIGDTSVNIIAARTNFSAYAVERGDPDPFQNTYFSSSSVSGTSHSFSEVVLGETDASREIIVTVAWADTGAAGTSEISALTIGGVSATRRDRNGGDNQSNTSEIWSANVPTGLTGTVAITFTGAAVEEVSIAVYRAVDLSSATPVDTGTGTNSASVDIQPGDYVVGVVHRTVADLSSLSGFIRDFFRFVTGQSAFHGSFVATTTETFTSNVSPTTGTPKITLAVWRPN